MAQAVSTGGKARKKLIQASTHKIIRECGRAGRPKYTSFPIFFCRTPDTHKEGQEEPDKPEKPGTQEARRSQAWLPGRAGTAGRSGEEPGGGARRSQEEQGGGGARRRSKEQEEEEPL